MDFEQRNSLVCIAPQVLDDEHPEKIMLFLKPAGAVSVEGVREVDVGRGADPADITNCITGMINITEHVTEAKADSLHAAVPPLWRSCSSEESIYCSDTVLTIRGLWVFGRIG
jgi:hypothetical protein